MTPRTRVLCGFAVTAVLGISVATVHAAGVTFDATAASKAPQAAMRSSATSASTNGSGPPSVSSWSGDGSL